MEVKFDIKINVGTSLPIALRVRCCMTSFKMFIERRPAEIRIFR